MRAATGPVKASLPLTAGSNATTPKPSSTPCFLRFGTPVSRSNGAVQVGRPVPDRSISLRWVNPWARESLCNRAPRTRASKQWPRKLRLRISAKPPTTTRDSANFPCESGRLPSFPGATNLRRKRRRPSLPPYTNDLQCRARSQAALGRTRRLPHRRARLLSRRISAPRAFFLLHVRDCPCASGNRVRERRAKTEGGKKMKRRDMGAAEKKAPISNRSRVDFRCSNFDFRVSVSPTAWGSCALPILRSGGAPFRASARPGWRWSRAAARLHWELCRPFFCESPPAVVPRSPKFPSADCSVRAAALLQNLLRRSPLMHSAHSRSPWAPAAGVAGSVRAPRQTHSSFFPQNPPRLLRLIQPAPRV